MQLVGHIDEVTRLHVVGWVADRDNLENALTVAIFVNGEGRGRVVANAFREGLAGEIGPGATGRYCFRFEFVEPLSAYERNEVAVRVIDSEDDVLDTVVIEAVEWRRDSLRHRPHGPILVSSIGRSGSTLVMALLSAHPKVVVSGGRPYEVEMISYYAYALRTLIRAGDHQRSLRPDRITAAENRYQLGFNPYLEPSYRFSFNDPSLLERFRDGALANHIGRAFRDSILDYYEMVARDQGKGQTLFFAEKTLPETEARTGARFLFGNLREIIIVRDLRDVLCSFISSAGVKFDPILQDLSSIAATLASAKASIDADDSTFVMRYEDLIADPACIGRMFRFLGLYPLDLADTGQIEQLFRVHGTSRTPAGSIGRWRRDLTPEQIERCRAFDSFHEIFGYDAAGRSETSSARKVSGREESAPLRLESAGVTAPSAPSSEGTEEPSKQSAAAPEPPLNELMLRFESLGENCEFGLVQRRCGAEPLGLFRFSSAPLAKLLPALQARFAGFGEHSELAVELSSNGREYMVRDDRYGFLYHAWVLADEMRPEEIREREARRLPLLIRKLVEDLTAGHKLLVVRGMDEALEADQVARLLAVLRSYGPNTLFWVALADADHPPGTVEWAGPHLLKGYIDRFAPGENAHDLSLDCWVALCRAAERLWRPARPAASEPVSAAAE